LLELELEPEPEPPKLKSLEPEPPKWAAPTTLHKRPILIGVGRAKHNTTVQRIGKKTF